MYITSKKNSNIQNIVALHSKKGRRALGRFIIEGKKQVQEAFAYGMPIQQVILSENFTEKELFLQKLFTNNLLQENQLIEVPQTLFEWISTNKSPQGVLAVLTMPDTSVKAPMHRAILLDEVQDCGNLGTIIRSANAFGIQDIYLKNTADPFSPKTVQASMGGVFFVRLHIGSFSEIVQALQGCTLIGADVQGKNLQNYLFPKKSCIVLGNEGNGISTELKAICNDCVTIPMQQQTESLNVAVAASILMYSMQSR